MRILLLQGHPDSTAPHYCHALADAYAEGAVRAGHELTRIDIGAADVSLLHSQAEWKSADLPDFAARAQEAIRAADHIVLVFPLWMGGMPAVVKAWLEQVFREGFAMEVKENGWVRHLKGKSGRLIVTMGMPAFFYRWYFGQPGTRLLRRSILGFSGLKPVHQTLIGRVDSMSDAARERWLERMRGLGEEGG